MARLNISVPDDLYRLTTRWRRQVNLDRREAEVVGKGGKSRLVLLTTDAAHWLRRYLETRADESPWLFVSNRKDDDGVLRQIGQETDRAAQDGFRSDHLGA